MSDVIIVSFISLFGTLAGTFGGIVTSNRLTGYRLEQLEKKVEQHNNLIERMYKAEECLSVHCEQIKVINHRIEDLEKEPHDA